MNTKEQNNKTSHHICGFWFHINWENENVGFDQHGNKWLNKEAPEPDDEGLINRYLDGYNQIKKDMLSA